MQQHCLLPVLNIILINYRRYIIDVFFKLSPRRMVTYTICHHLWTANNKILQSIHVFNFNRNIFLDIFSFKSKSAIKLFFSKTFSYNFNKYLFENICMNIYWMLSNIKQKNLKDSKGLLSDKHITTNTSNGTVTIIIQSSSNEVFTLVLTLIHVHTKKFYFWIKVIRW